MTSDRPVLGFLGIGLMGERMTLRLLAQGYAVHVWNFVAGRTAAVEAAGARVHGDAASVTRKADIVLMCVLDTDADMLGRLVFALAENAIRHTTQGGVEIAALGAAATAMLRVRDSGVGLDPVLARALERLASAPEPPAPATLGFGLRLIGRLVRELHGTLSVEADADGTTITVTLPALARIELPRVACSA